MEGGKKEALVNYSPSSSINLVTLIKIGLYNTRGSFLLHLQPSCILPVPPPQNDILPMIVDK